MIDSPPCASFFGSFLELQDHLGSVPAHEIEFPVFHAIIGLVSAVVSGVFGVAAESGEGIAVGYFGHRSQTRIEPGPRLPQNG